MKSSRARAQISNSRNVHSHAGRVKPKILLDSSSLARSSDLTCTGFGGNHASKEIIGVVGLDQGNHILAYAWDHRVLIFCELCF